MTTELTPADKEYGYTFGCDDFVDLKTAALKLGVTKRTVERYIKAAQDGEEKRFRFGKHENGKRIICRRSLEDYKRSLEY